MSLVIFCYFCLCQPTFKQPGTEEYIVFFPIGLMYMYVSVERCVEPFMYVFLVDVVKCFVASALNTGAVCHCLLLQIQMGLIIG